MKRILTFGILPFILGIIAAWLRANELVYVYDISSGLPSNPMWFTPVLFALVGISAIVFLFFALSFKRAEPNGKASPAIMPAAGVCFLILFAYAGYELYMYMQIRELTHLIFGILTLLTAISQLFIGVKHLEARDNSVYNTFAAIPVFWACYALILYFRDQIADPVISRYIYMLLAFMCIVLFLYTQCAYVFGIDRQKTAVFSGSLAVFFSTIGLFSNFFTTLIVPDGLFPYLPFSQSAPLAAFLIYIPFALEEMLRNNNRVGLE